MIQDNKSVIDSLQIKKVIGGKLFKELITCIVSKCV
jgi:hypothetical protein